MRLRLGVTFGPAVLISVGLVLSAFILGALAFGAAHEALEQQLDHRIAAESHDLQVIHAESGIAGLEASIARREDRPNINGMGYLLVNPAGARVAGMMQAQAPKPGWEEFLGVRDPVTGRRTDSQALTVLLMDGYRLVVAADREPIHEVDRAIGGIIAVALAVMLTIGLISAVCLGRLVQRRLDNLNNAAQAIIDGDHSRRMPRDPRGPEFDRVSVTLNHMLDRNAELLENLRQVSTDIAHDLRTPLNRLQHALDEALIGDRPAEEYRKAIETAADNSREMLDLFAALLRISEIETLQVRAAFRSVDLSRLVERVSEAFRPDMEAADHNLRLRIQPDIQVMGDRHLLSQLMANLIENALRHTPPGSTLSLDLHRQSGAVSLSFADDGPGIQTAEHEFVLRRFARLERSRSTPGHGLGLSLVAAITHAHFGDIALTDNRPGLKVTLRFKDAA